MALTGTLKAITEMTASQGNPYVLVNILYKGKDWKMSTFDENIIKAVYELSEGDEVAFETEKSGKYTNLAGIAPSGEAVQTATKGSKKTRAQAVAVKEQVSSDGRGDSITLIALLKSFIEAGAITKPTEVDAWGYLLAPAALKINAGAYFDTEIKNDEDIPF